MNPETSTQRIAMVGSGAIGGHFAARLSRAGHDVSMLARGQTLEALSSSGLRYESDLSKESFTAMVKASPSAAELGPQDLVIIALKGQSLPELAPQLGPLLTPATVILPVGNGLPWWYFLANGQALDGLRLQSVDPAGMVEKALPIAQVLGGSIFASCYCPSPGRVHHSSGARVVVGEPAGGDSERANACSALLANAGLGGEVSHDIRSDLWLKLLGNACFNPASLLTQSSTDRMIADPGMERLFTRLMEECITLGKNIGLKISVEPAQRIEQARKLGAIKTSMLQDLEGGRSVELDAILGSILECARALDYPMPLLDGVYALARLRAQQAGLYPA